MTKLVIILKNDGKLESVLCNDEIDIIVLKQGINDKQIDTYQSTLDEVEIETELI
jgi:hypothetical protein